ncbi:hypothetical protein ES707_17473 [subsurface metagenome]
MRVRKRFWVLRVHPHLYLFDSEISAITGVIELWKKGVARNIEEKNLHIMEATREGYKIKPFDWMKMVIATFPDWEKGLKRYNRMKQVASRKNISLQEAYALHKKTESGIATV